MLSALDRLYCCLDVFSMNSDLLEGAERMATATRLESPTFVHLTTRDEPRTAAATRDPGLLVRRLHRVVSWRSRKEVTTI